MAYLALAVRPERVASAPLALSRELECTDTEKNIFNRRGMIKFTLGGSKFGRHQVATHSSIDH